MNKTHVVMVFDRSGSMQGRERSVQEAYKAQILTLRNLANEENIYSIQRIGFGDPELIVEDGTIYGINDPRVSEYEEYRANLGMTALYAATRRAIELCKSHPGINDPKQAFLICLFTDGLENRSRIPASVIRSEIADVVRTDRFTFSLSSPPEYASKTAADMGIPMGNVHRLDTSEQGIREYSQRTVSALSSYGNLRSAGITHSNSFYVQTNPGEIGDSKIKRDLQKLNPSDFEFLKVNKEQEIRDFLEKSGKRYKRSEGRAYYQLSKTEELQPQKDIILKNIKTDELFGGDGVRDELGIPQGGRGKVTPGNHGNWKIFVQSTSVNRALVRGSEVLWRR